MKGHEGQKAREAQADQSAQPTKLNESQQMQMQKIPPRTSRPKGRVHISIHTQRAARKQAEHRCAFVDKLTGRRCNSTHGLEIDHVIPLAKGGTNEIGNLTILCDAHNRWKAGKEPLTK